MTDENPILNNPYEPPVWHYATNLQGELDYKRKTFVVVPGLVVEDWSQA